MAHQLAEIFQQRFQLHRMRMQRLLTGEGQQTLGQHGSALSRFQRAGDARRIRGVRIGQFQAADNHRQQVVEIMRQPARQLPDGLHLLAM